MCTNYRPVSVLPSISRAFEKVIYQCLMNFLDETNFIHANQFGFLPSSNTTSATLCAITRIIDSMEARKFTVAVFIDVVD